LFGCQPNIERNNIVEAKTELAVTNPLKIDTTLISKEKGGEFIPPKKTVNIVPDTTINNKFFLKDYKSLSNFYSTNDPLLLVEEIRESPVIIFGNKSNKEYLLAYQYEGDTENAYSCFEIGYFEDDKMLSLERSNQTEETNFQTESGLRLGLSLDEITLIKGKEYEQQESGGYVVINYSIEDYKNSPFLKRYNMPGYFIQIRLKNNAVRKITFGFDYP
jgi:hypothetical protein